VKPVVIALGALTFAFALRLAAGAQTLPAATPSPAASSAPTAAATPAPPNAIGPALFANDPCTSLNAIVTRPTVSNSVCTVRPNHVLIETGYQNTSADGGGNAVQYPQMLVRVGTQLPGLEAFIAVPTVQKISGGGATLSGVTDIAAGLKYVLGATPKFSYGVQGQISAPTGTNAFSANGTDAIGALNLGYALGSVFSLSSALQIQSLYANGTRYTSFVPSLVLAAGLPQSTSLYGEIARFSNAIGASTPTRTQYILGVSHDIGQRLQLDLEGGYSPTTVTGKYRYVGFGFSYYL